MAVVVSTKSYSSWTGSNDEPFNDGPYSGFSHECRSYDGCEVTYLADDDRAQGRFGYWSKKFDVDAKPGDVVFVVVVVYSTGGTFGRDEGCTEVVNVYKDPKQAKKVAKAIEDNSQFCPGSSYNPPRSYTIEVDGESIYCGSWVGYFESLDSVHVETEIVQA
jgi:hypothetical protein